MNRVRVVGVVCCVAFLLVAVTYSVLQWSYTVSNTASIKSVGVMIYQDANLSVPLTQIVWGVLEPSESVNVSAYVVNTSNVAVALSLTTENWVPANASDFIALSWDYDGEVLLVSGSVGVTFTLWVDAAISNITAFSFDMVVAGSG